MSKKKKVLDFIENAWSNKAIRKTLPEFVTIGMGMDNNSCKRYSISVYNGSSTFVVCSFKENEDDWHQCWDKAYFFLGLELLELKDRVKVFAEGVVAPI